MAYVPGDIDPKYLQVEPKEDSPSKLAYMVGKLTKFFLKATEWNLAVAYMNQLRDDIDAASTPNLPQVLAVGDRTVESFGDDVLHVFQLADRTKNLLSNSNAVYGLDGDVAFPQNSVLMFSCPIGTNTLSFINGATIYFNGTVLTTDLVMPNFSKGYLTCTDAPAKTWILTYEVGSVLKEFIMYIGGQDSTGFLGTEVKRNTCDTGFTFTRTSAGMFACPEFDPAKHLITFNSTYPRGTVIFGREDYIIDPTNKNIQTLDNFSASDSVFEYGGFLKIEQY